MMNISSLAVFVLIVISGSVVACKPRMDVSGGKAIGSWLSPYNKKDTGMMCYSQATDMVYCRASRLGTEDSDHYGKNQIPVGEIGADGIPEQKETFDTMAMSFQTFRTGLFKQIVFYLEYKATELKVALATGDDTAQERNEIEAKIKRLLGYSKAVRDMYAREAGPANWKLNSNFGTAAISQDMKNKIKVELEKVYTPDDISAADLPVGFSLLKNLKENLQKGAMQTVLPNLNSDDMAGGAFTIALYSLIFESGVPFPAVDLVKNVSNGLYLYIDSIRANDGKSGIAYLDIEGHINGLEDYNSTPVSIKNTKIGEIKGTITKVSKLIPVYQAKDSKFSCQVKSMLSIDVDNGSRFSLFGETVLDGASVIYDTRHRDLENYELQNYKYSDSGLKMIYFCKGPRPLVQQFGIAGINQTGQVEVRVWM